MNIVAFERAKQGTGASRRLRNSGRTPGIIYGGDTQPQAIEVDHNGLWHTLKKEAFHSSVLDMDLGGQTVKVVLRNVQYHPYKQQVLHIDFQRVDAKTKLHLKVPVHFVGADESAAVKVDHCTVNVVVNELDVTCMPSDLPEFISVDLSELKKGATLHLKDVKFPRGVTPVTRGSQNNPALVSMVAPVIVVEAPVVAAAPAKGKGKGKK
ncbi:50S ribosomal protein L25/general stress protein Ctc [Giesbergeria anulus]|uniref:Large ribosomal subunit protein bL25 n=1 Tax=Giesbergeria anulus TaxID=180197 RepID=A0A1H9K0W7_9BURK|nr:50S ribosomal protein L25/general stress protein Ctc [Giesbergeria anulus]MBX9936322.1 50S ribosomal protein L25/general stress protein Ctc [Burkholderiaceae bacterium]SEQ92724.1 large subunit ribosomal protein L25 [Giesbergeria anulus]